MIGGALATTNMLTSLVENDTDIKQHLEDEAGHPAEDIEIWSGADYTRDCYSVRVFCRSCERKWQTDITTTMMRVDSDLIGRKVIDLFKHVGRTICFRFSLVAELAEWVTQRVADAGAEGVKYSSLLKEATEKHLCSPKDVDAILMRLGFRVDFGHAHWDTATPADAYMNIDVAYVGGVYIHEGTVRLPAEHPLNRR